MVLISVLTDPSLEINKYTGGKWVQNSVPGTSTFSIGTHSITAHTSDGTYLTEFCDMGYV